MACYLKFLEQETIRSRSSACLVLSSSVDRSLKILSSSCSRNVWLFCRRTAKKSKCQTNSTTVPLHCQGRSDLEPILDFKTAGIEGVWQE